MHEKTTVVAAGDIFITRRLPGTPYAGEKELASFIGSHDVRFANLEITIHDREGYPGAVSGGTWAMCHPNILKDLPRYDFNVFNSANNHSLDYSINGLEATMRYLDGFGVPYAGVGKNLADASAPVYIETPNARVALIACVSSCPEHWMAGQQRMDMLGRPGVNALRIKTRYHVTHEQLENLKAVAKDTYINAAREQSIAEGFATPDKGFWRFGNLEFEEDTSTFVTTYPNPADMKRITAAIAEARSNADLVFVSIHAHEELHGDKESPAEFLRTFGRACIDAGANGMLGHGPHIIRGIEIYKGAPIFYSLGDFLFENDTTTHQPADFHTKYGLNPETATAGMGMDTRSRGNTVGLAYDPRVWESILPSMSFENGKLTSLKLYPIDLGFDLPRYRKGLPALTEDLSILERMRKLSEEFGTKIAADGTVEL